MRSFFSLAGLVLCATSVLFLVGDAGSAEAARAAFDRNFALSAALAGQYHNRAEAVPPAVLGPVSALNFSLYLALDPQVKRGSEPGSDPPGKTERQYHEDPKVQLALGLAAVYVVFLLCWVWATRVRPRGR